MIYNDPKLIFIHIPKTGGTSIREFLNGGHHGFSREKASGRVHIHATLQVVKNAVNHSVDDYKVLAVKRNTWERILSFYLMSYKEGFKFPTIPELQKKGFVSFNEFYHTITPKSVHIEDYFHYLSVDGVIHSDIHYLEFDDLENELYKFFEMNGYNNSRELVHRNENKKATSELRNYLLSDPEFIEVIGEKYRDEIDYFGFTPPKP